MTVLQHLAVERQIGHDLLQPTAFLLKLPQPLHLRWHQTAMHLLPIGKGRRADLGFPAHLRNPRAALGKLDDECLLGVRELARFHRFRSSPSLGSMRKTPAEFGDVSGDHITSWSSHHFSNVFHAG